MTNKGMKCVSCSKNASPAKLHFQGIEIDGWKCSCGEEYFDPEQAEKILLLNKALRKEFEITLGQIRSNLIIRIPVELAQAMDLEKGEKIKMRADGAKSIHIEVA